jgi:hypothetical protein
MSRIAKREIERFVASRPVSRAVEEPGGGRRPK